MSKVRNTLGDLNNHLFEMMERLNDDELDDDELDDEQLEKELKRADGMAKISQQILQNGELQFKAMKHMDEYGYNEKKVVPAMLEVRNE